MTLDQFLVFATLALTLILFVNGKWRYDVVAVLALLSVVLTGLIPVESAFTGFSNPAVVTVAAVLVLSRGLQNSGIVDMIGQWLSRVRGGIVVQLLALTGVIAVLSAFMNNVGALALLLPVTIQLARKKGVSPSVFLMPIAFASLLGGMTTLIGTPPNIIVAAFREQAGIEPFRMFDFAPVGVGVALVGLLFISLVGWRLIPLRRAASSSSDLFEIGEYVTEVRVPAASGLIDKRLREMGALAEAQITVIGLVRGSERRMAPGPNTKFRSGDILIVSAGTEAIESLVSKAGVELVGSEPLGSADLESEDVGLVEAVVTPNSLLVRETAFSLNLRANYGVNLLAVSRQGARLTARLDRIRLRMGDVLLLQAPKSSLAELLATLGCLPLAQRGLRIGQPRRILLSLTVFGAALALAATGVLPPAVAFVAAAATMVIARLLSLQEAYESIDWPIIILLGAMIPVGEALERTGAAQLVADTMLHAGRGMPAAVSLVAILVATMFLSDLVNNAAAVVLMAPIAISLAEGLGARVDPFLMAIAIGASCAFLTPIGHQSNTLVMGPGGYHFGDYWRMGLLLELLVVVIAVPLILWFWPLH